MSERIYTWLLRLFPSEFREAYGQEALQLFRDRSRDEHGLFRWLRLWMDLLLDLVISVPRTRHHALLADATIEAAGSVPVFHTLDYGPRHRGDSRD